MALDSILRALPAVAIQPAPDLPEAMQGYINVRGDRVPVLRLRARLGLPERDLIPEDVLLLARCRGQTLALPVDDVVATEALHDGQVAGGLPFFAGDDLMDAEEAVAVEAWHRVCAGATA